MNRAEQQILVHHAVAIDWLCQQLAHQTNVSADAWRATAFEIALQRRDTQPPDLQRHAIVLSTRALRVAYRRKRLGC